VRGAGLGLHHRRTAHAGADVSPVHHPRGSLTIGGVLTGFHGTLPSHSSTDLLPHDQCVTPLTLSEAPQLVQDPREVGAGPSCDCRSDRSADARRRHASLGSAYRSLTLYRMASPEKPRQGRPSR
jgi:hypothetical protein